MRVGINWLILEGFCDDGAETVIDLFESMGVERLMDGRLRAAGLISKSGIVKDWRGGGGPVSQLTARCCQSESRAGKSAAPDQIAIMGA